MEDLEEILEQGKKLEIMGEYEEAKTLLTETINETKKETKPNNPIFAELLNQRGIVRRMLGEYEFAFVDYNEVLRLINAPDEQKALAHVNLADFYRAFKNDTEKAHRSLGDALRYVEKELPLVNARLFNQRGLVFNSEKNYPKSIEIYEKAMNICGVLVITKPEDRDAKRLLAQISANQALNYILTGEKLDKALELQEQAFYLFKEIKDKQGIFNVGANIGKNYSKQRNHEKAIEYYKGSLKYQKEDKDGRNITPVKLLLAESYMTTGKYPEAKSCLERFVKGVQKNEMTDGDISVYKETFDNVLRLYNKIALSPLGFDITSFGEVEERFKAI